MSDSIGWFKKRHDKSLFDIDNDIEKILSARKELSDKDRKMKERQERKKLKKRTLVGFIFEDIYKALKAMFGATFSAISVVIKRVVDWPWLAVKNEYAKTTEKKDLSEAFFGPLLEAFLVCIALAILIEILDASWGFLLLLIPLVIFRILIATIAVLYYRARRRMEERD